MDDSIKIPLTAGLAFLVGYLTRFLLDRRNERRTLIRAVADKYISGISTGDSEDSHFRLGLLQRSGAALLTEREFASVVEITVGHGCPDPTKGHDLIVQIPLLRIIRTANAENIDIGSAENYIDWMIDKLGTHVPPTAE